MKSEFAMSSRDAVQEAADWLEGLSCLAEPSSEDGHHRIVVYHDEGLRPDVARIVTIVDPAASEVRDVDV
jgi:hypothetical protein